MFISNTMAQHAGSEWRFIGGDQAGTRFSTLRQINRANVHRLKRAWVFHTGEGLRAPVEDDYAGRFTFQCTPLVIDDVLYLSTSSARVIALDSATGRKLWEFDPQAGKRKLHQHRGVSYWEGTLADGRRHKHILFASTDAHLIALDPATGKPCREFGQDGRISLRAGIADRWPNLNYDVTSPPAIYKNLVIVGARVPEDMAQGPGGDVRAFDAGSGKLIWTFHTVPRPGEAGHESWQGDS